MRHVGYIVLAIAALADGLAAKFGEVSSHQAMEVVGPVEGDPT